MSNYKATLQRPWWRRAVCATVPDFLNRQAPQQKKVCEACPVTAECLREALETEHPNDVRHGWPVRGGLDGDERRLLMNPTPGALRRQKPIKHGSRKGYNQHRHRGEDPCDACRAGNAEEASKYRARRTGSRVAA